jgi:hypothetical protein
MARLPVPNRIINLLDDDIDVEFFHTADQRGYVTMPVAGRRETFELSAQAVERHINSILLRLGKVPAATVAKSVIAGCEVLAFDGPCQQVYTRVADLGARVVIDLADETGRVVVCTKVGWSVVDVSPVAFRRAAGMLALPEPRRADGALGEFGLLCGEITDAEYALIIGSLVVALRGRAPYPLLSLVGGAGSGKSTLAEMLRGLVDPNKVALRPFPDSLRDLAIMADNSALLMFDNVSEISQPMSDSLCRFTSGGGYSTRRLYKNREEELFEIARPALVTSISNVILAEDLAERTLFVHLDPLTNRRSKADILASYEAIRASVLAELLDGVCAALTPIQPPADTAGLPRLLDAVLTADPALAYLGFGEYAFSRAHDYMRAGGRWR